MNNEFLEKGNIAYENNDYELALQYYEKFASSSNEIDEDTTMRLAEIYINVLYEYPKAVEHLRKLQHLMIREYGEYSQEVAELYQEISHVYEKMEMYNVSIEWLEKTVKIFDKIDEDQYDEIANNYEQLSELHEKAGYYEKAIEYYKYSIASSSKFWEGDIDPDRFDYYPKIITLGIKAKKYDEIYGYAKQTYQDELNISDYEDFDMINIYKFITCLSYKIDNIDEFNKNYNKLLDITREYGEETCEDESTYISEINKELGDIFALLGENKTALEQYFKVLESYKACDEADEEKFKLYYSMYKLYTADEVYNEAHIYINLMTLIDNDVIEEVSFDMDIDIYYERVNSYITLELFDEALIELNKLMNIDKYKNPIDYFKIYFNIATVYEKMKKNEDAIKYYNLALDKVKVIYGIEHPKTIDVINKLSVLS